jgi:hypothetical protein
VRSKRETVLAIIAILTPWLLAMTVAAVAIAASWALDPPIITTLTRRAETEEATGATNRDQVDWFDRCPFDPYTPTPQPTQAPYTPAPSPTCRHTHTPVVIPTFTLIPTHTPYPTQPDPHLPTYIPTSTPASPTRTPTATTISPVSPLLIP